MSDFKIIVVDDSDYIRNQVITTLNKNQIPVVADFKNATDTFAYLKDNTVDCALVDVVIPQKNGIEITQYIKNKYPKTEVIMMSSLEHDKIVIEAINAGAIDFLTKPLNEKKLIKSIENIKSKKQ